MPYVASIIFLEVLSNFESIQTKEYLSWLYHDFKFQSEYFFSIFLGALYL